MRDPFDDRPYDPADDMSQDERDSFVDRAKRAGMTVTWKRPTLVELEREALAPIEDAVAEAEQRVVANYARES